MTWERITLRSGRVWWMDREHANRWLTYVLQIANPDAAAGKVRQVLNDKGLSSQVAAVREAWIGLQQIYRAMDLLPWVDEHNYIFSFQEAYGKSTVPEPLIRARGNSSAGAIESLSCQAAINFLKEKDPAMAQMLEQQFATQTRDFIIRASLDQKGDARVTCEDGLRCIEPSGEMIQIAAAAGGPKDCKIAQDWRCTFWNDNFTVFLPALAYSMDLAFAIATRIHQSGIEVIADIASQLDTPQNPVSYWKSGANSPSVLTTVPTMGGSPNPGPNPMPNPGPTDLSVFPIDSILKDAGLPCEEWVKLSAPQKASVVQNVALMHRLPMLQNPGVLVTSVDKYCLDIANHSTSVSTQSSSGTSVSSGSTWLWIALAVGLGWFLWNQQEEGSDDEEVSDDEEE